MINFDIAFNYLLKNEGMTFTNSPSDPGGPTKFGVTLKSYQAYLGQPVSAFDIENLTLDEARDFYLERYWNSINCDKLSSSGIATSIFDTAVLYGPSVSTILAQKTVSLIGGVTLKFDGILGDMSIKYLNIVKETDFLNKYHDLVLVRIDNVILLNPKEEVYRKGWTNRANRLLTLTNVKSLVSGS